MVVFFRKGFLGAIQWRSWWVGRQKQLSKMTWFVDSHHVEMSETRVTFVVGCILIVCKQNLEVL